MHYFLIFIVCFMFFVCMISCLHRIHIIVTSYGTELQLKKAFQMREIRFLQVWFGMFLQHWLCRLAILLRRKAFKLKQSRYILQRHKELAWLYFEEWKIFIWILKLFLFTEWNLTLLIVGFSVSGRKKIEHFSFIISKNDGVKSKFSIFVVF